METWRDCLLLAPGRDNGLSSATKPVWLHFGSFWLPIAGQLCYMNSGVSIGCRWESKCRTFLNLNLRLLGYVSLN